MGISERKEREKEQRREVILNAAQKIFFEKGFGSATMDEIAESAELSKGTLYLYFNSKEDLYLLIMNRGTKILYEMMAAIAGSGEPTVVKIAQLGTTYYRFFLEYRNYFRMFHHYQIPAFHGQVSEEVQTIKSDDNKRIWKLVTDILQQGIAEGEIIPTANIAETAMILWSSVDSILMRIDYEYEEWKTLMNVDLERALHTTNRMLLEAILTDTAKLKYQSMISAV